jgi:inosose dehydratase
VGRETEAGVLKVGHTGITWGIPCDLAVAYREVAELGYAGFETFGSTIEEYEDYAELVSMIGIPTCAAFCWGTWIDPSSVSEEIAHVKAQADALRAIGGDTVVIGCGPRPRPEGFTESEFSSVTSAFNQIGEHCAELGLRAGVHPHTGSGIETRRDIDRFLESTTGAVGFAPDTGQIANGFADPVAVFSDYRERIVHVHLKDWNGVHDDAGVDRSGYFNYTPIGDGVVPIREILVLLDDTGFDGWVNVELDGTDQAPRPPREAAEMSKAFLQRELPGRIAWH